MPDIFDQLAALPKNILQPYITHIRFPFYKNLVTDARIDFKYPLTAIVGMNGSSKSSILRAIYGAPTKKSVSEYWFESNIDIIKDGNTEGEKDRIRPSSFIYGYWNSFINKNVEVLKTRVRTKNRSDDYWEPAKPQAQYGMEKMPSLDDVPKECGRSATRWNTLDKNVIYLDFRHKAISAFDRYFYNGEFKEKTKKISSKQDFIRERSKYLQDVIQNNIDTKIWHKIERINSNIIVPEDQKIEICKILGKNYSQIRIIEHKFFTDTFETTIYVSCEDLRYSEAFAGSGEFAVISLVTSVMNAPEKSLILLDEPEVSVHPGAQEKMLEFLADQIVKKKHQIVFTTHSQSMLQSLPKEAIHVLYEDHNNKIDVRSNVAPSEAFSVIGAKFDKKTIIVEDKVAKLLIEHILKDYNILEQFDVKASPNGAEWIKTRSIVDGALYRQNNVIYILDGDKKHDHIDPDTIPPAENDTLAIKIKQQTGCDIQIPHASDNQEDKINKQRQFLKYYKDKVFYFPTKDPEDIIWEVVPEEEKVGINVQDSKMAFADLTRKDVGENKADDILHTQKRFIHKIDSRTNPHCQYIYNIIEPFI